MRDFVVAVLAAATEFVDRARRAEFDVGVDALVRALPRADDPLIEDRSCRADPSRATTLASSKSAPRL
jgi:hypothetical protein